jgi:hypothetical protein
MYTALLAIVPNGMLAVYYKTADQVTQVAQIGIFLLFVAIGLYLLAVYLVIASKTVAEAHRFSAWKGLGTIFLSFLILWSILVFLLFLFIPCIIIVAIIMQG